MEEYVFKLYEDDSNGAQVDVNINATYKTKNSDSTNFGISGSVNVAIEDVFHEKDDYIGEATLEYIDPTSTTIEFPNYGFKLDIANY